ncbi:hypothetical protein EI555_009206 [Monodon monoceros]|uniref:B-cell receptor-associated protein n=1 Tax=Monodon monoceros TaxID=40151 RepID=A0A4U1EN14_MONMO|nr:hypothetical protein EI555_009206 [Monodon monoceros]
MLRRLVTLISQQATLLASNEAFKKQAESASEAAKKYMEENDQLKKEAAGGVKLDGRDAEVKVEEENRSLKADLQRLKDELAVNKQKLEKAENEALAMRKQSEGLTKEYDRLLEEHAKLQARPRFMATWGVSVLSVFLGVGCWARGSLRGKVNRWGFRVHRPDRTACSGSGLPLGGPLGWLWQVAAVGQALVLILCWP